MSYIAFKWSFWGFLNEDIAGVWKLGKFFWLTGKGQVNLDGFFNGMHVGFVELADFALKPCFVGRYDGVGHDFAGLSVEHDLGFSGVQAMDKMVQPLTECFGSWFESSDAKKSPRMHVKCATRHVWGQGNGKYLCPCFLGLEVNIRSIGHHRAMAWL